MAFTSTAWMEGAACRSLDPAERDRLFFPPSGADHRPAVAICAACPVRTPCLRYALDNYENFGIWGGTSERERRRMRRRRRLTRAA